MTDKYTISEESYKNGYAAGFEAGKKAAMKEKHPRGHWTDVEGLLVCSECGHATEDMIDEITEENGRMKQILHYPYFCGRCGARMDGDDNARS